MSHVCHVCMLYQQAMHSLLHMMLAVEGSSGSQAHLSSDVEQLAEKACTPVTLQAAQSVVGFSASSNCSVHRPGKEARQQDHHGLERAPSSTQLRVWQKVHDRKRSCVFGSARATTLRMHMPTSSAAEASTIALCVVVILWWRELPKTHTHVKSR